MPNRSILHIHPLNSTKLRTTVCLFIIEAILFSMRLHGLDVGRIFCTQSSASLCFPFGCYFIGELIACMRHYCALNVSVEQSTIFKFNLVHFFIMVFLAQQTAVLLITEREEEARQQYFQRETTNENAQETEKKEKSH
jgi:uncharacterized protein YacL